jgi:hypothetical protein
LAPGFIRHAHHLLSSGAAGLAKFMRIHICHFKEPRTQFQLIINGLTGPTVAETS